MSSRSPDGKLSDRRQGQSSFYELATTMKRLNSASTMKRHNVKGSLGPAEELCGPTVPVSGSISLPRHENLYPLAMPHVTKIVSCTAKLIRKYHGVPVDRKGVLEISSAVTNLRNMKQFVEMKPLHRFVRVHEGKLKAFRILDPSLLEEYKDNDPIDENLLEKDLAYSLQRAYAIRYDDLLGTEFSIVFRNPRDDSRRQNQFSVILDTVRSISNMSFSSLATEQLGSVASRNSFRSRRSASPSIYNKKMPRKISSKQLNNLSSSIKGGSFSTLNLPRPQSKRPSLARIPGNKNVNSSRKLSENVQISQPTGPSSLVPIDVMSLEKQKSGTSFSAPPKNGPKPLEHRSSKGKIGSVPNASISRLNMSSLGQGSTVASSTARESVSRVALSRHGSARERSGYLGSFMGGKSQGAAPIAVASDQNTTGSAILFGDGDEPTEIDEVCVTMKFDTVEECQNWLQLILIEIENMAKVFLGSALIIRSNKGKMQKEVEFLYRKAVDAFTLAKGTRDSAVHSNRRKLGELLQNCDQVDEADFWQQLAFNAPPVSGNVRKHKNKMENLASFQANLGRSNGKNQPLGLEESLAQFLLEHGRVQIMNEQSALLAARYLMANYREQQIARMLEDQYGNVPTAFLEYVTLGRSNLELMQSGAEQLKIALKNSLTKK